MKFRIDHDMHIHTQLSLCSLDPKQTVGSILAYAENNGLHTVAVTDHYWDGAVHGASEWYKKQDFSHISASLPLPKSERIRFLFGCESEMNRELTLGIPKERYRDFGFIIIPTTHLHMNGFTIIPELEGSPEGRAALWVKRLESLLREDLPWEKVGIAHLACPLINRASREEYLRTLDLIPEGEMERLFAIAAQRRVGIELNLSDMKFSEEESERVLRPFRIAKHQGCKFYLGTDAHHPKEFKSAGEIFSRAINLLGLTEDDKLDTARA